MRFIEKRMVILVKVRKNSSVLFKIYKYLYFPKPLNEKKKT